MTVTVLAGAATIAAGAISLFFLRFWRESRDRLFLLFAIAFAIFAVNRILLTIVDDEEGTTLLYAARAGAFALIIAAIVDKTRSG